MYFTSIKSTQTRVNLCNPPSIALALALVLALDLSLSRSLYYPLPSGISLC